eukprot:363193-Chlamydomonas_euryale.AAC.11
MRRGRLGKRGRGGGRRRGFRLGSTRGLASVMRPGSARNAPRALSKHCESHPACPHVVRIRPWCRGAAPKSRCSPRRGRNGQFLRWGTTVTRVSLRTVCRGGCLQASRGCSFRIIIKRGWPREVRLSSCAHTSSCAAVNAFSARVGADLVPRTSCGTDAQTPHCWCGKFTRTLPTPVSLHALLRAARVIVTRAPNFSSRLGETMAPMGGNGMSQESLAYAEAATASTSASHTGGGVQTPVVASSDAQQGPGVANSSSNSSGTNGTSRSGGVGNAGDDSSSVIKKKKFEMVTLPTMEQMMQEDAMNNCAVKTVLAGVMGGVSGIAFGLFFAALENSHGVRRAAATTCFATCADCLPAPGPCTRRGYQHA